MPTTMNTYNLSQMDIRNEDKEEEEKKDANKGGVQMLMEKKFLEQRKLFLWGEVNDDSMKVVMEKLLYFEADKPGEPIHFYINTPGGSITAGMAVYDTMKLVTSPIHVTVTGMAASMGSILLSGGEKGHRYVFPSARVLIHQPLIMGRIVAPAVDINIQAQEMEKLREELNNILANASGQPLEKIQQDTDRDFYLTAQEAIEYGLADKIVESI
ncbi:ATP-dependent Clp protease proteolytic subunit [Rubellicoccus peritrichatus]|uniref:ATP-dependent Clp protease proteolytic subunit n=1 Tax=Rubellicoccus peritrichatus TaxID=3080537 RepID=A0AAQ3LE63_9BACT|nr:ATP-dependent Clp protease proteolytic subunit [Puniceicoccus sp. CR14]WOO42310.1 ATP-dependent Clp protease proteolytic subunit [Puniceicoccus sp. CR14]